MATTNETLRIRKSLFRIITNDATKTAKVAGLVYVTASEPGFTRVRTESGFHYLDGRKRLRERDHLERIRRLVLPPAWEDVWICKHHNGHLQATGIDKRNRKQYRYHEQWIAIRNKTKFYRIRDFGLMLPEMRKKIKKDLARQGFPQEKVLAVMVSLLERVNLRVGNALYEKIYGSFGLTTLKDHHVRIDGSDLKLMFKGKKGIVQNLNLSSKRLARIVQGCKDIPGKELFQYYDGDGIRRVVDSGMVNSYIKEISGSDFTAKDFRTWAGTIQALIAFREVGSFTSAAEMNRKIPAALDVVAKKLGNTRAVCKKYYVHPLVIDMYQDGRLKSYIDNLDEVESGEDEDGYSVEERLLMDILNSRKI